MKGTVLKVVFEKGPETLSCIILLLGKA
jgi:hypothetical protein